MSESYASFDAVRERLEAIVDEVNAEGITLDEALRLYEEAVKLGLQACDMSEEEAEAVLAEDEAAASAAAVEPVAEGAAEVAGVETLVAAGSTVGASAFEVAEALRD